VIGEGATEAILLPTLLREAVPAAEVNYQVAPGLSNANPEAVRLLDFEAARIAFLVDGDSEGRKKAKRLANDGIPPQNIVRLGGTRRPNLTIEDLVERRAFAKAVNEELARWHPGHMYPTNVIPARGRSLALKAWCKAAGIDPPDKVHIANQLLRIRKDQPLTDNTAHSSLREVHEAIVAILERATHMLVTTSS
jgi:predicted ATP-dependent endonuclease of OLD family